MKKRIVTGLFTALAVMANAQSFTEWQNPEVNAVNRAPMHTNYFAYESEGVAQTGVKEHSSRFMTLRIIRCKCLLWTIMSVHTAGRL